MRISRGARWSLLSRCFRSIAQHHLQLEQTLWRNSSSHVSGFKYVSSSGSGFKSISSSVRRSPFTGEVNLCKCCILLFNFVYFTIPFSAVSARYGALGQQVVQQLLAVFSQSIKLWAQLWGFARNMGAILCIKCHILTPPLSRPDS